MNDNCVILCYVILFPASFLLSGFGIPHREIKHKKNDKESAPATIEICKTEENLRHGKGNFYEFIAGD